MNDSFQYTLVVTSCDRHDMLRQTLESFCTCIDIRPVKTVIVEDSATPRPDWLAYPELGEIVWIQNGKRRGQGYAVDRGYAEVETEYLFHMEDDRPFVRSGPIIADSLAILECYPEVLTVMLLDAPAWVVHDARYPFLLYRPSAAGLHPLYDNFAFGNGLRRLSDYHKVGGNFARYELGREIEKMKHAVVELYLGPCYQRLGYIMAHLGVAYTKHIGDRSPYLHEQPTTVTGDRINA